MFWGTALRGMLLNAYGWSKMGQIALIGAIVSFILAGVMLVFSGLGLWHSRRVAAAAEIWPSLPHHDPLQLRAGSWARCMPTKVQPWRVPELACT